ncbi:MAG: S8 family serine peptidase [Bosea sp.]|uniref:S8 family serine peptidase n=1 Tax=Bosea sp. (in: a-proteobacteria) TaxID=1871050 RepID=UPI00238D23CA|nr:S8 family serine peptidase [Bosea sp. (in: a-proteobacteria)]MCP4739765.1 S8 family serine peptidase [Bosea sp. (in: a-proteobacteria)]
MPSKATRRFTLLASTATSLLFYLGPLPALASDLFTLPDTLVGRRAGILPAPATTASLLAAEYNANHGLAQINAADAYALGLSGKGVLVAVVDSGIDPTHAEFAGRISPFSLNFGFDHADRAYILDQDKYSHGTHVAGTIAAARDGLGMHGVAYNAEILALRAIVPRGGDVASAINYAAERGAKVLNGSYGPSYPAPILKDGSPNPDYSVFPLQPYHAENTAAEVAAIRRAGASDMVMVFAAGNEREEQPVVARNPIGAAFYPAIRPSNANGGLYVFLDGDGNKIDTGKLDYSDLQPYTIAVVAVDRDRKIASFSNYCGIAAAWCLAAPGVDVFSTVTPDKGISPTEPYSRSSGTSMAAPHVAGAAALVREAFPFMTAPQVVQSILTTATDLGSPEIYGWGLLNVGKAVRGPGQFVQTFDVNTRGYSATFANDISGAGGLIKRGEGRLELTGRNTYAGGTSVVSGILALNGSVSSAVSVGQQGILRGTGLIDAGLFSAGTVMPGNSPGTMFVWGPVNFTGTNRFVLDIDGTGVSNGAGNYSRLVAQTAAGHVAVNGRIVPVLRDIIGSASNGFVPSIGTSFHVLVAEGGMTGSFSGLDQPASGLPANARFDALYRADGLSLIVTPGSYGALAGLSGNARAVAGALDTVRPAAGTRPDRPKQEVYDALYNTAPTALPNSLASLSGQSYADARMAMVTAQRAVGSALDQRLSAGGLSRFDQAADLGAAGYSSLGRIRAAEPPRLQATKDGELWGQALYGFGRTDGDTNGAGSNLGLAGGLIGVDKSVFETGLVGAAFGYTRTNVARSADAAGRTTLDSYSLSTYGRLEFGEVTLRGALGASFGKTDVRRAVELGTVRHVARGQANGYGVFGHMLAGYRVASLAGLDLSPEAGFSLNHFRQDGLTEAQAGAFALTLRGESQASMRSLVGARLATPLTSNGRLRVDFKTYWSHEFGDNVAVQRASLLGASFTTRSPGAARDGALIGASLSGFVTPQVELTGSYDGDLRAGAINHRFALQAKARW